MILKHVFVFFVGLLAVLQIGSCTQPPTSSEPTNAGLRVGAFKGLVTVSATVNSRIGDSYEAFNFQQILGDYDDNGLPALLGAYDNRMGASTLQNAVPNPVNTMLWEIAMDGVAKQIALRSCLLQNIGGLAPGFKTIALKICQWPIGGAEDRSETLREFWLALMRYDAPQAEMEAWLSAVTAADGALATLHGEALVKDLSQSVLMNPYFLLAH